MHVKGMLCNTVQLTTYLAKFSIFYFILKWYQQNYASSDSWSLMITQYYNRFPFQKESSFSFAVNLCNFRNKTNLQSKNLFEIIYAYLISSLVFWNSSLPYPRTTLWMWFLNPKISTQWSTSYNQIVKKCAGQEVVAFCLSCIIPRDLDVGRVQIVRKNHSWVPFCSLWCVKRAREIVTGCISKFEGYNFS